MSRYLLLLLSILFTMTVHAQPGRFTLTGYPTYISGVQDTENIVIGFSGGVADPVGSCSFYNAYLVTLDPADFIPGEAFNKAVTMALAGGASGRTITVSGDVGECDAIDTVSLNF